jgi:hypothetical protein
MIIIIITITIIISIKAAWLSGRFDLFFFFSEKDDVTRTRSYLPLLKSSGSSDNYFLTYITTAARAFFRFYVNYLKLLPLYYISLQVM